MFPCSKYQFPRNNLYTIWTSLVVVFLLPLSSRVRIWVGAKKGLTYDKSSAHINLLLLQVCFGLNLICLILRRLEIKEYIYVYALRLLIYKSFVRLIRNFIPGIYAWSCFHCRTQNFGLKKCDTKKSLREKFIVYDRWY